MSGVGPGASGLDSGIPGRFPFRRVPQRFNVPAGPGVGVTFPTDPGLIPYLRLDDAGASGGLALNLGLVGVEAAVQSADVGVDNEKVIERRVIGSAYVNVAEF